MADTRSDQEWQDLIDDLLPSLERREDKEHPAYPQPTEARALAQYIDHTLLKLDATQDQIDKLCEEAKEFSFKSVCVRLPWVARCVANLSGTDVVVACVVGFHEGTQATAEKVAEATAAVGAGARELDMVLNRGYVQSRAYRAAYFDVAAVRQAAPGPKTVLKVIVETARLERAEIAAAAAVAQAAGADFVKTSTGFDGRGASVDDVRLMKAVVGDAAKVKASGGVRSREDALEMIKAGADRIGASSGVAIVQGMTSTASY